jgi:hypothetical protein
VNKTGLLILIGSVVSAAVLMVIWFVGFIANIGGSLIHLALLLALLVGSIGGIVGLIVLLVGKKA